MDHWTAQASDRPYALGEGPVWEAPRTRLLWADIAIGTVHTGHLADGRMAEDSALHVDRTVRPVTS